MLFKCFIIHFSGDWNLKCTLSLFWGRFCVEKYGELIMCIVNVFLDNNFADKIVRKLSIVWAAWATLFGQLKKWPVIK